jgi:membrane-associated phospholipid phosphatase
LRSGAGNPRPNCAVFRADGVAIGHPPAFENGALSSPSAAASAYGFNNMTALTEFGDAAVLLPIALALLFWLSWLPDRRVAVWWIVAVALCIAVTALLKMYLYPCPADSELRSPSGHVSLSVLVYGGIGTVLSAQLSGWRQLAVIGSIAAAVGGIAASRVLIEAHTAVEVVTGFTIGLASLVLFVVHYPRDPAQKVPLRALCLATLLLMTILHGHTLHAEEFLHRLDAYIGFAPIVCP